MDDHVSRENRHVWRAVMVLALYAVLGTYTMSNLFSYVGFMMVRFTGEGKDAAGYTAGLVASSYYLGRIPTSYFWGYVSDGIGRKPVMILSLCSMGVFSILFGMADNVKWAVTTRFLMGLTCPGTIILRILTPEVAGTAHVVEATGYVTGAFGCGMAIGPALGGLLSQPAKNFPALFRHDGLFARYPYLLPNLVGAGLALICIVLTILFVPETLIRRQGACARVPPERPVKSSKRAATPDAVSRRGTMYHQMAKGSDNAIMTPPRHETFNVDDSGHQLKLNKGERDTLEGFTSPWYGSKYVSPIHRGLRTPSMHRRSRASTPYSRQNISPAPVELRTDEENEEQTESSSHEGSVTWSKHSKLPVTPEHLRSSVAEGQDRERDVTSTDDEVENTNVSGVFGGGDSLHVVRVAVLLCASCLLDVIIVGFDELYPLWAISTSAVGGLDWNMVLVGQVFLLSGIAQSLFMFTSYKWCSERVGIATFHRAAGILATVLSVAVPLVGHLNLDDAGNFLTSSVIVTVLNSATYTVYNALIMASVNPFPPRFRGKLSGLMSAGQCVGGLAGPVSFSIMFAWSVSSTSSAAEVPLVDQHFAFVVGALLRGLLLLLLWNVLTAENMTEVMDDPPTPGYDMSPWKLAEAPETYAPESPGTFEEGRRPDLV